MHGMLRRIGMLVLWVFCGGMVSAEPDKTVSLPTMVWFQPVLEPGLAHITLVCTVAGVEQGPQMFGNPTWNVRLKIDERIIVAKHYEDRMRDVKFITSSDSRKRKLGERIVYFAGGEAYEGDDFLKPCWKGTATDLGILLHDPADGNVAMNDTLLEHLRKLAKGGRMDSDFMTAFAEFSPAGVAQYFIAKLRSEETKKEEFTPLSEDESSITRPKSKKP